MHTNPLRFFASAALGALALIGNAPSQELRPGPTLVDQFVAKAKSTTAGVQAAVHQARKSGTALVFGGGTYRIDAPLSFGKLISGGVVTNGRSIATVVGNGATLLASGAAFAGQPIVSYQGAPFSSIQDLNITTERGTIAAAGLALGRDPQSRSANRGRFASVRVFGSFTQAALYMCCSESNVFQRCFFTNTVAERSGVIVEQDSAFRVQLGFGRSTNTFNRFTDCNAFSNGGAAVQLAATCGCWFENCLFDASTGGGGLAGRCVEIINHTAADLGAGQVGGLSRCTDIALEKCSFHGEYEYGVLLRGAGGLMDQILVRDPRFRQSSPAALRSHIAVAVDELVQPLSLYGCEFEAPTIDFGSPGATPTVRLLRRSMIDITPLSNSPASFRCRGNVQGELAARSVDALGIHDPGPLVGNRTTVRLTFVDTGEETRYPL